MTSQITPEDIESKFKDMAEQVDEVAESSRRKLLISGGLIVVVSVLIFYLLGRRSANKGPSIMEIRRV